MVVGSLTLELHLPQARSLKDKRQVVKGFKEHVRRRFNAAVAEVDFQDLWQRALLGVVTVSGEGAIVEETLERILGEAHELPGAIVVGHDVRLY